MSETNGQLLSIVERIERLTDEKQTIADDIKEIFAEAKGNGFDPAALRIIIKERKIAADAAKKAKADEVEAIATVYRTQLQLL